MNERREGEEAKVLMARITNRTGPMGLPATAPLIGATLPGPAAVAAAATAHTTWHPAPSSKKSKKAVHYPRPRRPRSPRLETARTTTTILAPVVVDGEGVAVTGAVARTTRAY